jgi:hypothetical protein
VRTDRKSHLKADKKAAARSHKRGIVGYNKKTALLEDAITQMNAGKYGRSSAALKELLALDPHNMEARRLFATLHLRLGSLIPARQAFDSLVDEAFDRQDYWLAESLLREYLAAGPRCVPYLEKLGSVHERKGNAAEAVAEYGKAVEILIEDPDQENPQHASQLYTKIRELAPANPIAFRLASFFDAHTGELVARPAVVPGEGPVVTPSSVPAEESVPAPSMIASIPTAAPWEEAPPQSAAYCPPVQEPASYPESSASQEVLAGPSDEAGVYVEQPAGLESSIQAVSRFGLDLRVAGAGETQMEKQAGSTAEIPAPIDPFVSTPDNAREHVPSSLMSDRVSDSMAPGLPPDTPVPPAESEPSPARETEFTSSQSPSSGVDEDLSSPLEQGAGAESIPPPMPWEDILESIIAIPDQLSSSPPAESGSVVPGPGEPCEAKAPAPVVEEPVSMDTVAEESAVTPQTPPSTQDSGDVSRVSAQASKYSWKSVFDAAWKFGGKPASSPSQTGEAQTDTAPIVEIPPAESSSLQAESSDSGPVEIPERAYDHALSDSTIESVAAPMPWDQVQDQTITILAPQEQEAVAGLSVEQPVEAMDVVEVDQASLPEAASHQAESEPESSLTPAGPVTETEPSQTIHTPPASPVSEPEFRFAASASAQVVHEPPTSGLDGILPASSVPDAGESFTLAAPEAQAFATPPSVAAPSEPEPAEPVPVSLAPAADTAPALIPVVESVTEEIYVPGPSSLPIGDGTGLLSISSAIQAEERVGLAEPLIPDTNSGQMPAEPEPVAAPDQAPLPPTSDSLHTKTSEAATETPRHTSKKRRKHSTPEPEPRISLTPASFENASSRAAGQSQPEEPPAIEVKFSPPAPSEPQKEAPQKEEWIKTGETIRFIEEPKVAAVPDQASQAYTQTLTAAIQSMSTAAAAVDVLFDSSSERARKGTGEQAVEIKSRPKRRSGGSRIGTRLSAFVASCFSTTRSMVMSLIALAALSGALVAIAIGAVGLTWIILEKPPSPAFQNLTTSPQRTLSDHKKNGYLLLLGFDAAADEDPIQVGYERKSDPKDADRALACLGSSGGGQPNASANVAREWFNGPNPVGQFKAHQGAIAGWVSKGESALSRYKQWQRLSFEDWGFGQTVSPPCASILFTHQLYLAEGFLQNMESGIDRLEADMESWRIALGQAKTIPVKTLALQAVNDDIAVASGLLVQSDFDGKYLARLTKLLRPLDQVEISIRWPMQSELVSATKIFESQLKAEREEEQSLTAAVASVLPLPKQRRFNAYAEYYEASYKAAGEGRHGALPKWKNYIQFPPNTLMDYLANPIENIVGLEPLAPWDLYNGLVVDTDARLRLASLQAWLRRGPQDAELLTRIAKAGQNFYDPYTGLPMLVNLKKGALYSVGHDGKDQDADPQTDVVVAIPMNQSVQATAKTSSGSSKSR